MFQMDFLGVGKCIASVSGRWRAAVKNKPDKSRMETMNTRLRDLFLIT